MKTPQLTSLHNRKYRTTKETDAEDATGTSDKLIFSNVLEKAMCTNRL